MARTTEQGEGSLNGTAITYRLPDGTTDVYEPEIPSEGQDEVKLVGAYPDFVVHNLAAERDDLQSKVNHLEQKVAQAKAQGQGQQRVTAPVGMTGGLQQQLAQSGSRVSSAPISDDSLSKLKRPHQPLAQSGPIGVSSAPPAVSDDLQSKLKRPHHQQMAAPGVTVRSDWQSKVNLLLQQMAHHQAAGPTRVVSAPPLSADLHLLQANHLPAAAAAAPQRASVPVTTGRRFQANPLNPLQQQPPTHQLGVGMTGFSSLQVNRAIWLQQQAQQRLAAAAAAAAGNLSPLIRRTPPAGQVFHEERNVSENSAGNLSESSDAGS